mmetsp:Transcript_46905/g.101911  ORF Transcript_46905/g.101911 Transcript_46905/m.101911 type:complete len:212 (+) Transcript_46905:196-831(+)
MQAPLSGLQEVHSNHKSRTAFRETGLCSIQVLLLDQEGRVAIVDARLICKERLFQDRLAAIVLRRNGVERGLQGADHVGIDLLLLRARTQLQQREAEATHHLFLRLQSLTPCVFCVELLQDTQLRQAFRLSVLQRRGDELLGQGDVGPLRLELGSQFSVGRLEFFGLPSEVRVGRPEQLDIVAEVSVCGGQQFVRYPANSELGLVLGLPAG